MRNNRAVNFADLFINFELYIQFPIILANLPNGIFYGNLRLGRTKELRMFEEVRFTESNSWQKGLWGNLWRVLVVRPALAWQAWRCSRAKAYLLAHDEEYRSNYIDHEIVRQRNILYDEGMSPAHPNLPDRWSIADELRPMAWPRRLDDRG